MIASFSLRFYFSKLSQAGRSLFDRYRQFPLAYTTLIYLFVTVVCCYSPTAGNWVTGFLMMSLPLAVCAGLAACIYLFRRGQPMVAMAGLMWFFFSFLVIKRLVGLQDGSGSPGGVHPTLNVLSFNSETLPVQADQSVQDLLARVDIACFQEYSPNPEVERQYPAKVQKLNCFGEGREVGLALFSRYPIVQQYAKIWDRAAGPDINGFIYADIAYGADTIRVVNVHLWSMGVRTEQAVAALKAGKLGLFASEAWDTFRRLKEGFVYRQEQLEEIETFVAGSRYPVIICGDFNETPMGYAYGKLDQNFRNAFEEAGQGLGFTLNRHPYWVRIDQQFVSRDWQIQACQTITSIAISDHFPVLGQYTLGRAKLQ